LRRQATAVLEKWPFSTEPGLPARFGLFATAATCYQPASNVVNFAKAGRGAGMSDQARSTGVRTGFSPAGRLLPGLLAAIALCGCQTTSPSTRQTRAEPIPAGKTDDATPVTTANSGAAASVTKTSDGAGSAPATQATSAGLSWASLFGRNQNPDRVVLPRNDQEAENGSGDAASDKTAANEF
jgi:hypothetical protein